MSLLGPLLILVAVNSNCRDVIESPTVAKIKGYEKYSFDDFHYWAVVV